jgi:RNA polymerase sigma factor (TIGR02999 family)
MNDVSRILQAIGQGDAKAADQLLPLVYDELRKLAAQRLTHEKPGQTLEATGLVHEAYLRLIGGETPDGADQHWDNRGHFFAAAAEAMRRILVESARRKKRVKHGGGRQRVDLADRDVPVEPPPDDLLAMDEALTRLAKEDPEAAQIVQLHFFAGLSIEQVADTLGISRASAYRQWSYARAWLRCAMGGDDEFAPTVIT